MNRYRHRREYFPVAAIVIGIALLLLLATHTDVTGHAGFAILLPVIFVGVLSSPCILSSVECARLRLRSDDPALPASFQRPPPLPLA